MPVVTYRLVQGLHTDEEIAALLTRSSALFAEVVGAPIDRIRAFVEETRPQATAVAGQLVSEGAAEAPFFEFLLFAGRPVEHAHRLLEGFTDLLVEILGSERSLIRGRCQYADPDHWAIAGVPASIVRRAEVEARAAAAKD
jgi:4-oxalocrotonate tautomerase